MQDALLKNLVVADFGTGRSGALTARFLADLGARTWRVEPESGDPFYDVYPAYRAWQAGKTLSVARDVQTALTQMASIIATADICIIGGEDYPDLAWRPDVDALAEAHPRLIILDVGGARKGGAGKSQPAVEILAQARTGLVFEQHADRPSVFAFPAGSYGAVLEGLIGVAAALCERETSGLGQVVSTSLDEGVLTWLRQIWYDFPRPDEVIDGKTPKGVHPLIFKCRDGDYIHFVLGAINSRKHVYEILGIENPSPSLEDDPHGLPTLARGIRDFCGDIDLLQGHVANWRRSELLAELWARGVPAEAVGLPGECWDDAQTRYNGIIAQDDDGGRRVGLPFRLARFAETDAAATDQTPGQAGPLDGLRVLDLGSFIAGPHSSLPLVDLGADVIKVETPGGDVMRRYFRAYTASSRGKRSLAVDLKSAEGREILLKLCRTADMVHHNFRPGVTRRLGIEADTLRQANPGLIVLETAGYGVSGPNATRGGFDMIFQAFCGHEHLASGQGNAPENYVLPTIDLGAGLIGAIASLLGRYAQLREGGGAVIATSLLDAGIYLLSDLVQAPDGRFSALPELRSDQTGSHPAEALYQANDGWIAVAARDSAMARRMFGALGIERVDDNPLSSWGQAEARAIAAAISPLSLSELEKRFEAADVWAAACVVDAEARILADEAYATSGAVVTSEHPSYGHTRQLGKLFSLSRSNTPASADWAAVGEHSRQLLEELGYDDTAIDRLYRDKVVA